VRQPGADALVAADRLHGCLGEQSEQLVQRVGGRQRQRGGRELLQLLAAPALERGELSRLGVQLRPLDHLGALPGVGLDEPELALAGLGGLGEVGRESAHGLLRQGEPA
jgi:hypothetical protein